MATAKQICAKAREAMKNDAVIITAADLDDGLIDRLQVYFWDESEAAMDIITKADIVENWPDAGVFVFNEAGGEKDCLVEVRIIDGEEDFYLRSVPGDDPADDLGQLPRVVTLEAVELISQLKDSKF